MTDPWYKNGLRFACTECGACCTGSPGYVWLEEQDIVAMCGLLNLSREEFIVKYTRQIGHRLSLKEDLKNYDCVFLKNNRCTIYSARPKQCRTFPWWAEHLSSEEEWKEAAKRCEGIDHKESKLYSFAEIENRLSHK